MNDVVDIVPLVMSCWGVIASVRLDEGLLMKGRNCVWARMCFKPPRRDRQLCFRSAINLRPNEINLHIDHFRHYTV